jgi:Bacterial SH3 domain
MAKSSCLAIVFLPLCLAALPAHAQDPAAALGKQRAAASRLVWEIGEAGHPTLGNVRFAFLKSPVETAVGNAKIFSRAYVSCQKGVRKLAIELTNTKALDDPGGLKPASLPKLVCNRPTDPAGEKVVQEELLANWDVSQIGDALARGFRAFPLRECASIGVVQEVELPAGWAKKTAQVEFDITPYNRELDSIFVTCGEVSAYAPAAAPVAVAAAPSKPVAAVPASTPAPDGGVAWRKVRTTSRGKTNVRSGPTTQSSVVIELDPGAVILVQRTASEWWRAKASTGKAFEGYIRQDRLIFK